MIVGSAEVVIRAIGDRLEGDIQKALQGAGKRAGREGNGAGDEFGSGFSEGSKDRINKDGVIDTDTVGKKVEKDGDTLGSKLANRLRASTSKDGESIGKDLGDKIGKGVERSRFQSTIARSAIKLGVLVPAIGAIGGALSSLVSGLFAVSSAAGTASASLVVIPGAIGAIGQAAATLMVGFKGLGKIIKEGFDPKKADQFKQALKGLAPEARGFVKEFVGLKNEFKDIQRSAQAGLFGGPNGLTASLKQLEPLLPAIAGGFKKSGAAVADAISSMTSSFTNSTFTSNFGKVFNTNNAVIRNFGKILGDVGRIIVATLAAASPIILRTSKALATFFENLRKTTEIASDSGRLTGYFEKSASAAKLLGNIFKNVLEGLHDIGKIAQPTGIALLKAFEKATQKMADFTDKAKNVQNTQKYFKGVQTNVMAIGGLVKELGKAFLELGSSPGIAKTADAFKKIIPDIQKALQTSVASIGPKLAELIGNLARLFTALEESGAITTVLSIFSGLVKVLTNLASVPLGGVAIKILAIASALGVLVKLGGGLAGNLNRGLGLFGVQMGSVSKQAGTFKSSIGNAGAAFQLFGQNLKQNGVRQAAKDFTYGNASITGLGRSVRDAEGNITRVRGSFLRTAGPVAAIGLAASGAAGKFGLANTAMLAAAGSIAGPWGTAAGAVAGFTMDIISSSKRANAAAKASKEAFKDLLKSGSQADQKKALSNTGSELDAAKKRLANLREEVKAYGKDLNSAPPALALDVKDAIANVKRLEGDYQSLADVIKNGTNNVDIKVDFNQSKLDFNSFIKTMKANKVKLSLDVDTQAGIDTFRQLQDFGAKAFAAGGPALVDFREKVQSIRKELGLSQGAANLLAAELSHTAVSLDGLTPGKKITISADNRALLNSLGVSNKAIDKLIADAAKPIKLNASVTGNKSIEQLKNSVKDLPKDSKIVIKTDTGDVETTVGNLDKTLADLSKKGVIDLKAPNASGILTQIGGLGSELAGLVSSPWTTQIDAKDNASKVVVGAGKNLRTYSLQEFNALVGAGIDPSLPGAVNKATTSLKTVDGKKATSIFGAALGSMDAARTVLGKAGEIKGTKANATVGVTLAQNAASSVTSLLDKINIFGTKKATATTTVTTKVDTGPITALQGMISRIKGAAVTIKTVADTSGVGKIRSAIASLKAKAVSIKTTGDLSGVNKIKGAVNSLKAKPLTIKTTGDLSGVSKVKSAISGIKPKTVKITTSADLTGVNRAKSALAGVKGKTVYINVVTVKSTVNKATGGLVSGPGGPTSDSIPAMLSNGEFVVKASATKRYLSVLQSINSGAGVPKALPKSLPDTGQVMSLVPSSSSTTVATSGPQYIIGELTLTPDSRVLLRGVAQETVDGNVAYNNSLKRAGH